MSDSVRLADESSDDETGTGDFIEKQSSDRRRRWLTVRLGGAGVGEAFVEREDPPATEPPTARQRVRGNAAWLLHLRWVAVFGQLITIGSVTLLLGVQVPLVPLLLLIALTAGTNLLFHSVVGRTAVFSEQATPRANWFLASVMMLDLMSLTGLLYFTGGPGNPFAIFYLVNVALAAMILPNRWGWTLTALAILFFGLLFVDHQPLPELARPLPVGPWTLQTAGLLVATSVCACVIIHFITRITHELRIRESQLRAAEQQRANSERLEALATLAAGAGHELATPLSTIAVVVKELDKHLEEAEVSESVREDVALIRQELDHCRAILNRMKGSAGQSVAEEVVRLSTAELIEHVLAGLRRRGRVRVELSKRDAQRPLCMPVESIGQAIRGVIQNGLDASEPRGRVRLIVWLDNGRLHLTVQDQGLGMPADVIAHAVEPFYTTKQPGQGMGMGLFLTKSVIDRLGGRLRFESTPGRGTAVHMELPTGLDPAEHDP